MLRSPPRPCLAQIARPAATTRHSFVTRIITWSGCWRNAVSPLQAQSRLALLLLLLLPSLLCSLAASSPRPRLAALAIRDGRTKREGVERDLSTGLGDRRADAPSRDVASHTVRMAAHPACEGVASGK
jgi:hypothetical protein